jgi:hypothetical protein
MPRSPLFPKGFATAPYASRKAPRSKSSTASTQFLAHLVDGEDRKMRISQQAKQTRARAIKTPIECITSKAADKLADNLPQQPYFWAIQRKKDGQLLPLPHTNKKGGQTHVDFGDGRSPPRLYEDRISAIKSLRLWAKGGWATSNKGGIECVRPRNADLSDFRIIQVRIGQVYIPEGDEVPEPERPDSSLL